MKNFILISAAALATGAFAQNSYIPDGISSSCSSFLTTLNTDSNLSTCLGSLLKITSAFSDSNATSTDVSSTLPKLCAQTDSCSNSATRQSLASFWGNCQDELSGDNSNAEVQELYDLLYGFTPIRAAICSTDLTTGAYCMSSLGSASSKKRRSINERDGGDNGEPMVDTYKFGTSGAPFLYLTTDTSSDKLCTPCTKSILQAYVTWEAQLSFAYGLSQSSLLGGQSALWSYVESTCGSSFIDTVTANANGSPLAALNQGGAGSLKAPMALVALVGGAAALLM